MNVDVVCECLVGCFVFVCEVLCCVGLGDLCVLDVVDMFGVCCGFFDCGECCGCVVLVVECFVE